ncbi:hypothetical protein [Streptomyces sp. H27-H5]|uniref:hypothetical protein n=1 Tax=Streptomyces sp. H27-H5 TaxID=2996460 RepID=UPI00226D8508|nr:hypothetical protein [Streptomyces sp. H27-H5]MCY0957692.1 hypothetical protein [Streptomyces sp. H27-H5]
MDQPDQKPRVDGVEFRRVTLQRLETTEIDGVPSTRVVEYVGWEPVPPRDWDEVALRGVTWVAVGFTVVAMGGGTASIGGLLKPMVPAVFAYGMGSCFAVAWLFCTAIEWRNRTVPERGRPAKFAGWFFLLLSMAAVLAYGHTLKQPWAGGFGASIDLIAKGSWWLLLREYAVPLDAGVAHWVQEQEQKLAGRALLSARVRRLNRRAAYQRAVGGAEYQAADAILSGTEAARHSLPTQAAAPVVQTSTTPAAAPVAPVAAAPVVQVSAPAAAPAVPAPAPVVHTPAPAQVLATPVPPVPAVTVQTFEQPVPAAPAPAATPAAATAPVPPATAPQSPALHAVGGPFKSDTIRAALAAQPDITDEALIQLVVAAHGEDPANKTTVPRTRRRIEAKLRDKKAS